MKKISILAILALTITSCGLIQQETSASQTQRERQDAQSQAILPTATLSPVPTATIDYQATVSVAQATAEAANQLMIEVTAAQDQRQHEELSWTAIADQATITAAALTMQADQATAAAYPTYMPATMTAQVEQRIFAQTQAADARTQLAATQNAPTHIVAVANSQAYAEYADAAEKANIGIKWAIVFFLFVLGTFILIGSVLRVLQGVNVSQENSDEAEVITEFIEPIPLVKTESKNGTTWLRSELPCTKQQLYILADGIINRGMTLAFNIWEGTPVHKSLQKIREEFQTHKIARNVRNANGMLDVTVEGERFLRYVVDHGEPPPPFVCLPESK